MSQTNRRRNARKPKPVHTKRHVVEDDDGWTHVVGGRKTSTKSASTTVAAAKQFLSDFSRNGYQYVNKTYEEIENDYTRYRKQWDSSAACGELKTVFARVTETQTRIDNVVCLGLGSFQNQSKELCQRAHVQLAALETIIGVIGKSDIRRIAQDPAFTDLDQKLLVAMKYEIIESPGAYEYIDEHSLVYAIHCYPDVYQTVGESSFPALYIGNDLEHNQHLNMTFGEIRDKALENLRKGYEAVASFPDHRFDFTDTKIYSSKPINGDVP